MYKDPFIKVEWEDVPENLTQERIKRVKTYFQNKYNSTNVKIVTKTLSNVNKTKLTSLEASDSILDHQYQKKLVKEFMSENGMNVKWDLINRLDDKVNSVVDKTKQNKVQYNKWYIRKIEFSNFLSYGSTNVLDFNNLDGITVVESTPRNFGGKSTATVDLLMFLFFNSTTKTKTNIEIFNKFTDDDEVRVKGEVTIDGENYIISRIVTRKKSKSGDYTVKNELEFSKVAEDGTVINLSGEQRKETEQIITSAIGTEEDFLATILTTGYNLEQLIESKPTARGQILTKFLGLEALKEKEEIAKQMQSDWSKALISNTHNIVDLQKQNEDSDNSIKNSEEKIVELNSQLTALNNKLVDLTSKKDTLLTSKNNDIDQELIRTNPQQLQREINELTTQRDNASKNANNVDVKEPSKYFNEDEYKTLKDLLGDLYSYGVAYKYEKDRIEKLIRQLTEGSVCPTCHRSLDDVDHSEEIENLKKEISQIEISAEDTRKEYQKVKKQIDDLDILKNEFDTYEKNKLKKARYELEVDQKQMEINQKQLKLDNYDRNKSKLEENQKIDGELIKLRTQIETANADILLTNSNINNHNNNITNQKQKIDTNKKLIEKIKAEEEYQQVFKTYLTIFGKNGISKVILKNMIPLLNSELHRLLIDSCYFALELNINDKNEVEFIMIDNETRISKSLSSGSGYERTISSLALRSVLTKVSSLPKPNIVVMDEVFGKVADDNLEMVGEFFKKIKNYFEHIFVISHNPLIRNWSDNIVMVKKEDNVSSIDFITTKIS